MLYRASPCERCHRQLRPADLIFFDYNDNAVLLCFPCCKIVLDSLMHLPLSGRAQRLQQYQERWMENQVLPGRPLAIDLYNGLLTTEEGQRIEQGRQVWQEVAL